VGSSAVLDVMYHFDRLNAGQAQYKDFIYIISFIQKVTLWNRYYYCSNSSGKLMFQQVKQLAKSHIHYMVEGDWNLNKIILKSMLLLLYLHL